MWYTTSQKDESGGWRMENIRNIPGDKEEKLKIETRPFSLSNASRRTVFYPQVVDSFHVRI
jgi:hypothetical protein